jgi:hypothetical protein
MPYQVRSLVRTAPDPHVHLRRMQQLPALRLIPIRPSNCRTSLRIIGTSQDRNTDSRAC